MLMVNSKIFIIGISRTGSKFYMQVLNSNNSIYIAPELVFQHTIKKDLYGVLTNQLKSNTPISNLVEIIYNCKLKDTLTRTLNSIDKSKLIDELEKLGTNITPYKIFGVILNLAAKSNDKNRAGAKFPIHHKYTPKLMNVFDESKVLFLTRDPRDIYYSDYVKKKKEKSVGLSKFPVKGFLLKPAVLLYTILYWRDSLNIYEKLLKEPNNENRIQLFKYENILIDENRVITEIAEFLNIKPSDLSNVNVKIVDSSFSKKPVLNRWESELNWFEKFVFKLLVGRKMNKYGY